MSTSPAREVGSDFEPVDPGLLRSAPRSDDRAEAACRVQSGRQALTLLVAELDQGTPTRVLVPEYFCESMTEAFVSAGWQLEFAPVDARLRCVPPSEGRRPDVVLSAAYFGVPERRDWTEYLDACRGLGSHVVSDESHRLLQEAPTGADLVFGSLRKLLPLPDGGFVRGLRQAPDLAPTGASAAVRLRAMRAKHTWLHDGDDQGHRELFAEAEALTDAERVPAMLSAYSADLLVRLDRDALAARRIANLAVLADSVGDGGPELVHLEWYDRPLSHALVRVPRPQEVRARLSEARIYCPIHWPPPRAGWPRPRAWREDLLSIPVDHRYDGNDMERVGRALATAAR